MEVQSISYENLGRGIVLCSEIWSYLPNLQRTFPAESREDRKSFEWLVHLAIANLFEVFRDVVSGFGVGVTIDSFV